VRKLVLVVSAMLGLLVAGVAESASAKTVWLCRPFAASNPCTPGLSTTVYSSSLKRLGVRHPRPVRPPTIDCFYVYPTVSDQQTEHANLVIDPEERSVARFEVARYSQYCRVFAPMYRQVTVPFLERRRGESPAALALPFQDVLCSFRDYLRQYNHGRGFVLIGHSQGSFMLDQLMKKQIDPNPALRRRLVTAIILGGNVLVRRGSNVGGDFKHIPACRSPGQLGCVIAFSTFDQTPPADAIFGRAPAGSDKQVLCTNPARLSRSHGLVDSIFPSKPFAPGTLIAAGIALLGVPLAQSTTVWNSVPDAFSAHCSRTGGANVLAVTARGAVLRPRPSPTAQWGLHLMDANVALGNLVAIVARDASAYGHRRH
jgi:Protein of unknown function (DUF3089)